ncbi:MAG TPA: PD-(D/E)XK nuclease family protein, partial [Vicinamibacteria bacterium]|nr:PD-(D/E)XK nuclease family protein [Vicinamibacteria bacterium]
MPAFELTGCRGFRGVSEYVARFLTERCNRDPLALAELAVLVPTTSAAHLVRYWIEDSLLVSRRNTAILPTITTPNALIDSSCHRLVDPLLREALLEAAFEATERTGLLPPFAVRGSLASRVLAFHDDLMLRAKGWEPFVRRALEELDAPDDQGAQKLAQLTRFLDASILEYRRRLQTLGLVDRPRAREDLYAAFPFRQVVVLGAQTLSPLELDLVREAEGIAELQFVIEHEHSPELSRFSGTIRIDPAPALPRPSLLAPEGHDSLTFVARDREECLRDAARLLKLLEEKQRLPPLHRIAIVVPRPLPYSYLAKKVFREAGIPYELQDSFPLAREPIVAAVDLLIDLVEHDGARPFALALLRSPLFRFEHVGGAETAAFDRLTLRLREPGSTKRWRSLLERLDRPPVQPSLPGFGGSSDKARSALAAVVTASELLAPLGEPASLSQKIQTLKRFLARFSRPLEDACPESELSRTRRAQRALETILDRLAAASQQAGDPTIGFFAFREKLHRAIESHTFAPRTGTGGVVIVDAASATFGSFDLVLLFGLNDGEWPDRGERNIFYPQRLLSEFGWPSDRELLARERCRFLSLLECASKHVVLFRHQLDDEMPTVPSPFLEDAQAWLESDAVKVDSIGPLETILVSRSEALRRGVLDASIPFAVDRRAGIIDSPPKVFEPVSPTAFELYLRCPFKYFARYLLGLEEEEVVDETLSARDRGRILHQLLQDAFAKWDRGAERPRPITEENYDEALALFRQVAISKVRGEHRQPEFSRLFGNAGEPGAIPWLLRRELARGPLRRRLVEHAFEAPLKVDRGPSGESPWYVRIKGRVDRADVDEDGTLHVFDYKSGRSPDAQTALQVPLYAMSLAQELGAAVREASYISFRDRKTTSRAD